MVNNDKRSERAKSLPLRKGQILLPIPGYAVEPETWAKEMSAMAAEYAGMPEGTVFLAQARRYMTLDRELKALREQLAALETTLNKV